MRPSVYARVSVGEWEAYACIITDWLDDEMTMIYVGVLEQRGEETIFMTLHMRETLWREGRSDEIGNGGNVYMGLTRVFI